MKVLVISGFLGAGKTTFLKELARRTHRDFAVMENEYGEVSVDGDVLREDAEKLNIWELTEGCICCTRKSDFAASVLTIAGTVDPQYLIVEPTGVGMLSKVLESIQKIRYEKIQILSPVTILDGHSFDRYRREFPEILTDQIRHAGTVVLSKMEGADDEDRAKLSDKIRKINPSAQLCLRPYPEQGDDFFLSLLNRDLSGKPVSGEASREDLQNLSLTDVSLASPDRLLLFLNGVVSGVFGNIVRAKGCLKAGDNWLRFDTADRTYSLTGSAPQDESKAVFIGTDLGRSRIREVLQEELTVSAFRPRQRNRIR